jgi:ZIP family zinc transporter
MLYLIALAAFLATTFGGLFALRFKDKLHLILGFSAGAIIAVAFFDLMPEALNLAGDHYGNGFVLKIVAVGFVTYLLLDRLLFSRGHSHHEESEVGHAHRGWLGAGSLSIHSFLDGIAIGLAFQVSSAVGLVVTVAVLVHDFSDGINTVNMILRSQGNRREAFTWLIADALAPVLGIIATRFFMVEQSLLGLILALFSGFFLYIGASDLLPESHHSHPTYLTTFTTVLGIGVLYVAIGLAGL